MRVIQAIYQFADHNEAIGKGCQSIMLSRSQIEEMSDIIPASDRERMSGVALVVGGDASEIITVLHAHDRKKSRHYYRH